MGAPIFHPRDVTSGGFFFALLDETIEKGSRSFLEAI